MKAFLVAVLLAVAPSPAAAHDKDTSAPCVNGEPRQLPLLVGKHHATPLPALSRPGKGEWFADPVYGSCVARVTDHEQEPPQGFARNDYSRRQPFNASGELLLVYAEDGYWHLYHADTLAHVARLNLGGGSVEPHWDVRNPWRLFVLPNNGGMRIDQVDVRNGSRDTVADFTDVRIDGMPDADSVRDLWPSAARLATRSEGSPSRDQRYWAFLVETKDFQPLGMVSYDLRENRIMGHYDFSTDGNDIGRPDHLSMSPSGDRVVVSWNGEDVDCASRYSLGTHDEPCGLMSFTRDLETAIGLTARGPHSDIGYTVDGNEVIVISNYQSGVLEMIDIETAKVTPLWTIYENGFSTALHVSAKAYEKPGWVLVSTYAMRGKGTKTPWYKDKIMAVELKKNPRILNIANTFNRGASYFSEPHAAVNRDFTRIVYNSNWGTGKDQDIDTYMIRLPSSALD